MELSNLVNLILICLGVFVTGVSLTLLAPFYPNEALAKGVSVTQSGVVLSTVFIATIVFTPLFGKVITVQYSGTTREVAANDCISVHADTGRQEVPRHRSPVCGCGQWLHGLPGHCHEWKCLLRSFNIHTHRDSPW